MCHLAREKNPFILCIQETNLSVIDATVCKSIWPDVNVEFSFQPSLGASGGLVTLWDVNEVQVWSSMSFEHVLVILGRFLKTGEPFVLFNVYAPCDVIRQQGLWNNLSNILGSFIDQNVCICGDFNVVCCVEERRSVGTVFNRVWSTNFNNFIEGNLLVDFPLRGRNFTWFRGDGKSMSRIDCFLLSESWCLTWPSCLQMAMSRGLSDHCPLVLSIDDENWGLRPFCMLKCWESCTGYNNFVRDKWSSFQVEGWGGYVLKEKFKLLKVALREWHQSHTQNIPARLVYLKAKIEALDLRGEATTLCEEEIEELHDCT